MEVYIKGIKMPKSCACCDVVCRYYLDHRLDGLLAKICHTESRLPDCPLIPIPPHGDLIDRDALLKGEGRYIISFGKEGIDVAEIERAPTIIEAKEADE